MTTHSHAALPCQTIPNRRFSFLDLALHVAATHRQRKILRKLNATALSDIGLTRDQADAEASRPIWDVPGHWLR